MFALPYISICVNVFWKRIRQAIIEFRPRLVVIDPIQAYLGSDSDLQIAGRARKLIGYQSSTVLDEPEREAGTTSIPIPQREESENIPLPDLPGQLENVQQSGNEIAKRGMPT